MQLDDSILSLRIAGEQDSEFLAELYRSTREDLLQLNLPAATVDSLIDMQFRAQQAGYRSRFPGAWHTVIEKEGVPIGGMIIHHGEEAIRLVYIALLPHERNRGHGRRLIHVLQSEAKNANKLLALSVFAQNRQAQRLYYSLGFQLVIDGGIRLEWSLINRWW